MNLKHWRFDWKLTLLVLVLLPILLRLGFWQLQREQEKLELQEQYEQRAQLPPVEFAALSETTDPQYRQVFLSGRYDSGHVFLLDNKVYQGRVGYEVVQPFYTHSGALVYVNRGWTAQGEDREHLPVIETPEGNINLAGSVYVPVGQQLTLGDTAPAAGWPKVIQVLDPVTLESLVVRTEPGTVYPWSVRLTEGSSSALAHNWQVISTGPEKHRAYAVQWFAMAAMLLLLYIYYSCRKPDAGTESLESGKERR